MKQPKIETITLDRIVGGGQTLGVLEDGKKVFVWNGLPGETVRVQLVKQKSKLAQGVAIEILHASAERIQPRDADSYLSTSPWQIMEFAVEQSYKARLIQEAFRLHDIELPVADVFTDDKQYEYRNKVEFSWWWSNDTEQLDLAFFRRGTSGKIPVQSTSLARPEINRLALAVRDLLRSKQVEARNLKTLLIRCNQVGDCVWQLYVKDKDAIMLTDAEAALFPAIGGEIIYSDPRSPASRITERLACYGTTVLSDAVLGKQFTYATESFFQVNIPVYEQALTDMQEWIEPGKPVVDMYSGVGSIGLSIGGVHPTLVEVDEHAYREMEANIAAQHANAVPVLAASERALQYIDGGSTIIVDPPRAGLHQAVIERLVSERPERIIYLSCNPVTQARDVALLQEAYDIRAHRGYNFFPRTPHIEHLVVLELHQS